MYSWPNSVVGLSRILNIQITDKVLSASLSLVTLFLAFNFYLSDNALSKLELALPPYYIEYLIHIAGHRVSTSLIIKT